LAFFCMYILFTPCPVALVLGSRRVWRVGRLFFVAGLSKAPRSVVAGDSALYTLKLLIATVRRISLAVARMNLDQDIMLKTKWAHFVEAIVCHDMLSSRYF